MARAIAIDELSQELGARLRGSVVTPSDSQYDEARALYNAMIDKRPALIARCVDTADVVSAVDFGRQQGLDIAVRGGGHNGAGLASLGLPLPGYIGGSAARPSCTSLGKRKPKVEPTPHT